MTVFAFMRPETMRIVLLVLSGGGYLAYHLFRLWRKWAWRMRWKKAKEEKAKPKVEVEERSVAKELEAVAKSVDAIVSITPSHSSSPSPSPLNFDLTQSQPQPLPSTSPQPQPLPSTSPQPLPSTSSLSGEELYGRAREIPHQPVPDFDFDGAYLELLGQSAAAGYAPALAKLGEYAMRRAAWVEAYYWMKLAKRNGMGGLTQVLREIRRNWAMGGFPDEAGNASKLFPPTAGSLGRALIHLDSGRDAAAAREFLKKHYPDYP